MVKATSRKVPKPTSEGVCPTPGYVAAISPDGTRIKCYKIPSTNSAKKQFFKKLYLRNKNRVRNQMSNRKINPSGLKVNNLFKRKPVSRTKPKQAKAPKQPTKTIIRPRTAVKNKLSKKYYLKTNKSIKEGRFTNVNENGVRGLNWSTAGVPLEYKAFKSIPANRRKSVTLNKNGSVRGVNWSSTNLPVKVYPKLKALKAKPTKKQTKKPMKLTTKARYNNNNLLINWSNARVPVSTYRLKQAKKVPLAELKKRLAKISMKNKKANLRKLAMSLKNYPGGGPRGETKAELFRKLKKVQSMYDAKKKSKKVVPSNGGKSEKMKARDRARQLKREAEAWFKAM